MTGCNVPKGTKSRGFLMRYIHFEVISIRYNSVPKGKKRLPKGTKMRCRGSALTSYNDLLIDGLRKAG